MLCSEGFALGSSKRKKNKTKENKFQSKTGKQPHKCAHCFQSKVVEAKNTEIIENRLGDALGKVSKTAGQTLMG